MTLTEYLTEYFKKKDSLRKFNNSEVTEIHYRERENGWLGRKTKWFPYDATDMEIANGLKTILTVPFCVAVGREQNMIWGIFVSRVFIPS